MTIDSETSLIDLTRATPPVTPELRDALKWALAALSTDDRLDVLIRSNRIGGNDRDCRIASEWLGKRFGYCPPEDRIIVGNGTQNLLSIAFSCTSGRNGVLLAEALTHPLVPPIAQELGITVVPVAIDDDGIVPAALDEACRKHPSAALYCNPTGHNPTASVMSDNRRAEIAHVIRRHDRQIIEDDVLGSLRNNGPLPMASFAPERVWYLQTLSKCIGLGFRVAYLLTPQHVDRDDVIGPVNMRSSWFPAVFTLEVANLLFQSGRFDEVAQSLAAVAERRRQHALGAIVGGQLTSAQGALHAWLRLSPSWTSAAFADACRSAGVLVRRAEIFAANPSLSIDTVEPAVRIALTAPMDDAEFEAGIKRVNSVLADAPRAGHRPQRLVIPATTIASPERPIQIEIRSVELSEVLPVRGVVLRPDEEPRVTISLVDTHPDAVHLVAYIDGVAVGVASSGPEPFPGDGDPVAYRLRGFAVLPAYRRQGIGRSLLSELKRHLAERGCELWWAYARTAALTTYREAGFHTVGVEFDMPPTGPHIIIAMPIRTID